MTGRWFVELLPIVFTKVLSKFGQMLKNPIFVQVEIHCNFRFKNIVIHALIHAMHIVKEHEEHFKYMAKTRISEKVMTRW